MTRYLVFKFGRGRAFGAGRFRHIHTWHIRGTRASADNVDATILVKRVASFRFSPSPRFIFALPSCGLYGCPCGFLLGGSESYTPNRYEDKYERPAQSGGKACTCTAPQIRRYLARISGPLLDRIDIHIEVPRLSPEELMNKRGGESSATVRRRVCAARKVQVERLRSINDGEGEGGTVGVSCNAQMKAKELRELCELDGATKDLLKAAINQFGLSGRAYDRILKVSRTISDLEGSERVEMHHVAEAINYRSFDRKLFG